MRLRIKRRGNGWQAEDGRYFIRVKMSLPISLNFDEPESAIRHVAPTLVHPDERLAASFDSLKEWFAQNDEPFVMWEGWGTPRKNVGYDSGRRGWGPLLPGHLALQFKMEFWPR